MLAFHHIIPYTYLPWVWVNEVNLQKLPTAVLHVRRGEDAGTRDLEHLHGCVCSGPDGDGRRRVRHHSQARPGTPRLVQRGVPASYTIYTDMLPPSIITCICIMLDFAISESILGTSRIFSSYFKSCTPILLCCSHVNSMSIITSWTIFRSWMDFT